MSLLHSLLDISTTQIDVLYLVEFKNAYDECIDCRRAGAEGSVLSVVIDDMTKRKTELPHHARPMKKLESTDTQKVPYNLTGALAHGFKAYAFWSSGSQLYGNVNKLIDVIFYIINDYEAEKGYLPEHLKLQLDNVQSNKCHVLFGALSLIMMSGKFKSVEASDTLYAGF